MMRSGGPAGIRHLVPGRWGIVSLDVANLGDEAAEMSGRMFFPADPYRQFGRRLWAPPRCVRRSWFPVLAPADLPNNRASTPINGLMLEHTTAGDIHHGARTNERFQSGLLPVYHGEKLTGILDITADGVARSAVVAMREARGLDHQVAGLDGQPLAPTLQVLDGLDRLVIADDRLLEDTAALASVRQWIIRGGAAWIMLDRTDPDLLDGLLGEARCCQIVDRVDLMEMRLHGTGLGGKPQEFAERLLEAPVPMARVLTSDVEIVHSVDNWPAAFWKQVGRGRVLVTTLGARGWTRRRSPEDPVPAAASKRIDWLATEPFERLAYEFYQPIQAVELPPEVAVQYAQGRVGYQVASRGVVIGTIACFVLALLVVASVMATRGKLEHIGWIGPSLAIASAVVLVVVGRSTRSQVPPTAASIQLIDVAQDQRDLVTEGQLATFLPEAGLVTLAGSQSLVEIDALGSSGTAKVVTCTDLDRWSIDEISLTGGVHMARIQTTETLAHPIRAIARFDQTGLVGQIEPGPFENLDDAVIMARRAASLGVVFDGADQFHCPREGALPAGKFLTSSVLSDEQRRREAVYRGLVFPSPAEGEPVVSDPAIFIWADLAESGVIFPEGTRCVGSTLLRVPLQFESPKPGARVAIPATFLPFESVPGPGRIGPAPTYSNSTGAWISPLTEPARTVLEFAIPASIRPARVERVVLHVSIRAPGRKLELATVDGEQFVTLATRENLVGQFSFDLTETEYLQPNEEGKILIALDVGPMSANESRTIDAQGWGIDDVRLELEATVLPPQEKSP
ncbi:MAG: hypothetical protein KDA42_12945 [Planctomycetales bacterium]|nr:hypothetical protein [Planctomycetales bacterium]